MQYEDQCLGDAEKNESNSKMNLAEDEDQF